MAWLTEAVAEEKFTASFYISEVALSSLRNEDGSSARLPKKDAYYRAAIAVDRRKSAQRRRHCLSIASESSDGV